MCSNKMAANLMSSCIYKVRSYFKQIWFNILQNYGPEYLLSFCFEMSWIFSKTLYINLNKRGFYL